MLLTINQIKMLYQALEKYPEADYVKIQDRENGTGLGLDTFAEFQNRGNLFRQIAPRVLGEEDITDVGLW